MKIPGLNFRCMQWKFLSIKFKVTSPKEDNLLSVLQNAYLWVSIMFFNFNMLRLESLLKLI